MKTSGLLSADNFGRIEERIEPTTKTATGNFLDWKAARGEHRRIDQLISLVIRDQPDAQASVVEVPGQLGDGGGLARTKEAADHDVTSPDRR